MSCSKKYTKKKIGFGINQCCNSTYNTRFDQNRCYTMHNNIGFDKIDIVRFNKTMLDSAPCNLRISPLYREVNFSKENLILMGIKRANLVNLSIITQIESKPLGVLGSPTMKPMEILSHFHSGISNGCNLPEGL